MHRGCPQVYAKLVTDGLQVGERRSNVIRYCLVDVAFSTCALRQGPSSERRSVDDRFSPCLELREQRFCTSVDERVAIVDERAIEISTLEGFEHQPEVP